MCGIVGFVNLNLSPVNFAQEKFFTDALYYDTLRGWDSTGVVFVKDKGVIQKYKKAVSGCEFIQLRKYNKMIKSISGVKFAIGHNRAATVGTIIDETAHPFTFGNITMVHNGTLDFNNGLDVPSLEVDSAEIAHALSLRPAKEVLEAIRGAFALVWYDADDKTINFARNKERPLVFATDKDESVLYYASEKWMIQAAEERYAGITDLSYETLPVGHHIKIPITAKSLKEGIMQEFTPYEKKYTTTTYGRGYYDQWQGSYQPTKNQVIVLPDAVDELENLKLEKDDIVIFKKTGYKPYGTTGEGKEPSGNLMGNLISNTFDDIETVSVMAYNTTKETWDSDDKVLGGVVKRAYFNTQDKVSTLVVTDVFPLGSIEQFDKGEFDEYDQYFVNKQAEEEEDAAAFDVAFNNVVYKDSQGKEISEEKYAALLAQGCAWCTSDLDLDEDIEWAGNSPVCEACVDLVAEYGVNVNGKRH